jgi:lactoylglutathione lyase
MHFAHIALWTRDLEAAAQFWQRLFGAEVTAEYHSRRRPGFVSRFVILPGGSDRIELMTGPWLADPVAGEPVGWDHLAIALGSVAAVDQMAARFEAEGLLLGPPRTTGDGCYEALVSTPDGIRFELTGSSGAHDTNLEEGQRKPEASRSALRNKRSQGLDQDGHQGRPA